MDDRGFTKLVELLSRIPSVRLPLEYGTADGGQWWTKFAIDIDDPLAWHVVQELGHVLNFLSLDERLPTAFKPLSPPPYLEGGPREQLSWVIECYDPEFQPGTLGDWLEARLPRPVEDRGTWSSRGAG